MRLVIRFRGRSEKLFVNGELFFIFFKKKQMLHISCTKTEYLHWDFSETAPVGEAKVSIDEAVVKSTTK